MSGPREGKRRRRLPSFDDAVLAVSACIVGLAVGVGVTEVALWVISHLHVRWG